MLESVTVELSGVVYVLQKYTHLLKMDTVIPSQWIIPDVEPSIARTSNALGLKYRNTT